MKNTIELKIELQSKGYKLLLSGFDRMVRVYGYKAGENGQHQRKVQEFLHYLEAEEILNIKKVQPLTMVRYYEFLCERPNLTKGGVLSTGTISHHMSALELFNEYLLNEGIVTKSISLPKLRNRESDQRSVLSKEQIVRLYEAAQTKRDIALLSLAYGCGMRRTEIENLNTADVLLSKGMLVVCKGKGDKRREIPLSESVIRDLKEYLISERHSYLKKDSGYMEQAFIVNNNGKRMSGDRINERVKILVQRTNDPQMQSLGITMHCLRHTISTHLLERGASMEFVRDFLGHAQIDTVQIYARRRKMKQRMLKRLYR